MYNKVPDDIKPSSYSYTESSKKIDYEEPKFKVGDIVRKSKHKDIFAKRYVRDTSEKIFWLKKLKTLFPDISY